jgi:hypothetical protein
MNITVISFLKKIQTAGVMLWLDGDDLRVNGPNNILTPDIVEILKNHKKEIIQILQHNNECNACENAEYIDPVGTGCLQRIHGTWEEQWSAADRLEACPRGYWN